MTEDEAKTKWCPFVRYVERMNGNMANNRGKATVETNKALCIGSECMAWRATTEYEPAPVRPEDTAVLLERKGEPAGYCGLAGKP